MMEGLFTIQEKEAIYSVLCVLVKSDYRLREPEDRLLSEIAKELDIPEDFKPIPRGQLKIVVSETLKPMSKEKKREFSRLMTKMARSDGHFGPSERAFVTEILDLCEIPFVHR
ncbi:MAG: TerB family tellurite resistance protein [Bacteroidales bacterium]|nr:TerB family tellurite resistance protein [Bacteroidales bacterium]